MMVYEGFIDTDHEIHHSNCRVFPILRQQRNIENIRKPTLQDGELMAQCNMTLR